MHNTKNLVFTIVLSIAIMFLWQYFYVTPRLEQVKLQQELAQKQAALHKETIKHNLSPPQDQLISRDEALAQNGRITIESPRLHGSISLKGARFDDLTLAKYKITPDQASNEVILLAPSNTDNQYFSEFGWVATDTTTKIPNSNTIWQSTSKTLSPQSPATLFWDNKQGLKFFITITIDENYMFKITSKVENYGTEAAILLPYGLISRTAETDHASFAILHEGALGTFNSILSEIRWPDLKDDKKYEFKSTNGWLGFTDKYWLTSIIPDKNTQFTGNFVYFSRDGKDRFQADYIGEQQLLAPGATTSTTSHLFAGAKEVNLLDNYAKTLDITLFDRAVDFGSLYFITKPLFKLLTFFHALVGNFGIAILLLTVAVKLIMFPLANKSYISMNQLKKLQPLVKEIQERHKDDKLQTNKAIMTMYKEQQVNPMSGCLPMLVQIPVFFALYKVLFVTIEMRHAPFFGWINDLSAPDPTTLFNLFGLFAWTPPSLLQIGAWPVIMAITMFFQQQMNPAPTDPIQAKIMKFLPVMFLFMFASFPAGLVIYWAWNNTLSIAQQWFLVKKMAKKEGKKEGKKAAK